MISGGNRGTGGMLPYTARAAFAIGRPLQMFSATCVILSLCTLSSFADEKSAAIGPTGTDDALPSVAGEHVRTHGPTGQELLRADVALSAAGLRVKQTSGRTELEMIQNFAEKRAWLVDGSREIAHELPVGTRDQASMVAGGGFLGTQACSNGPMGDERAGTWRGRSVAVFSCADVNARGGDTPAAAGAVEFVDREYGIVVYRRSSDGRIDELRNLRSRAYPEGHFAPPERYRAVDKRELFNGSPAIDDYVEPSGSEE